MVNEITDITRQHVSDETILNKLYYEGRLNEHEFLLRLFDLKNLPSRDKRFNNAYDDIIQHTEIYKDYSEDWIYSDPRINLLHCEDDLYLKFLTETIHPSVRPNKDDVEKIVEIYNRHLNADGFEIIQDGNISGYPTFSWHKKAVGISQANVNIKNKIKMKPLEKLNLVTAIAIELQKSMTYDAINFYLNQYGIKRHQDGYGSKRVYVQKVLEDVPLNLLLTIGEELGVHKSDETIIGEDPNCWNLGFFKLFISHLSTDKGSANNLKICLKEYAISGFVAHEDIEPSKEWLQEIERALFSMNGICGIVTPNFIKSLWCDQEIGIAIGRKVLAIAIKKEADPYGFFGKYQAIQSKGKTVKKIAEEVFQIVSTNEKSKALYCEMVCNLVLYAKNTEEGLRWINLLEKIPDIDASFITELNSKFSSNGNLNDNSIVIVANKIFSKYSLSKIDMNVFIKDEITKDDLPF